MDDQTIAKDLERGRQAKELLEHPLLQEAFSTIETEIINIWQETKTSQAQLREQSWLTLKAMKRLRQVLETWVNHGKIALAEKERTEQKRQKSRKSPSP